MTYQFCFATVYLNTAFYTHPLPEADFESVGLVSVVQSVILPGGTFWGFIYDSCDPNNTAANCYGDITKIIYPTGGSVSYQYENSGVLTPPPSGYPPFAFQGGQSRIVTQRIEDAADGSPQAVWLYNYAFYGALHTQPNNMVTVTDPTSNDTVHTFTANDPFVANGQTVPWVETLTESYQGTGLARTLLSSTNTQYQYISMPFPIHAGEQPYPPITTNTLPYSTTTTFANGPSTTTTLGYDTGFTATLGNPTPLLYYQTSTSISLGKEVSRTTTDYTGVPLNVKNTSYQWQGYPSLLCGEPIEFSGRGAGV